jgi:hypothetical protein
LDLQNPRAGETEKPYERTDRGRSCATPQRKKRPSERHDNSVNGTAQRETPHVGIFWVAQTTAGEARLLGAGCPMGRGDCLTYGVGHYGTWAHVRSSCSKLFGEVKGVKTGRTARAFMLASSFGLAGIRAPLLTLSAVLPSGSARQVREASRNPMRGVLISP